MIQRKRKRTSREGKRLDADPEVNLMDTLRAGQQTHSPQLPLGMILKIEVPEKVIQGSRRSVSIKGIHTDALLRPRRERLRKSTERERRGDDCA